MRMKQTEKFRKRAVKAVLSVVCSSVLLFAAVPLAQQTVSAATTAVTTGYLNLRSGPGTNYSIVLTLTKGASLTVIGSPDSSWVKVQTSAGTQGYCSRAYLTITQDSSSQSTTGKALDNVNLRSGPGTGYSILLTIPKGTSVPVVDASNTSWVKVTYNGKTGYCSRQYMSVSGSQTGGSSGEVSSDKTGKALDNVNLRSGAGLSYRILTTVPKGTSVKVVDDSNSQWVKVTYNGLTGYCSREYMSVSEGTSSGGSTGSSGGSTGSSGGSSGSSGSSSQEKTGVTTGYLNLRSGPGTGYSILLTLSKGQQVTVLDDSSAWAKVRTSSGKVGYCDKSYLKITGGSSGGSQTVSETAVTKDNLRLRQGPGTSYATLMVLVRGTQVTVVEHTNASWVKVKTASGTVGYCSLEYLTITSTGGNSGGSSSSTPSSEASSSSVPSSSAVSVPSSSSLSSSSSSSGGESGTPDPVVLKGTATDNVNLRQGPGTSYAILATVPRGTTLTILDNSNTGWVKVTYNGKTGYCSRQYMEVTSSESPADPEDPEQILGAKVTADSLRVRSGPGTNYSILTSVTNGTMLTVLDTSTPGWVKVQIAGGKIGYVSAEYVEFVYAGDDLTGTLSLSQSTGSIPLGKTLYIKANTSSSVIWTSSNSSVAVVENGYIRSVGKGTAVITAISGNAKGTCTVSVTDGEPVRTAYTSPNIVGIGGTVNLIAVTDTSRDAVKFQVTMQDGSVVTVQASGYVDESVTDKNGNVFRTRKWTGSMVLPSTGKYTVKALSAQNGVYASAGFTTDAYAVQSQDYTVSTSEQRRASDKIIQLIANWEGYSSTVYADMLTYSQIPTIGYGYTFGVGTVFYNNISKTEAWSLLVNSINRASYTTEVNRFMQRNNLLMNQNQADCLISFGYNVGAGYWNGTAQMDARTIMLNAVVPPETIPAGGLAATVTKNTSLYAEPSRSSGKVTSVSNGSSATVLDLDFTDTRDGWYKVKTSAGTGWINSGYLQLSNSASLQHDLNYTNAYAFGTDLCRWCMAGGKAYSGLLYRRVGEANVYNYNDYSAVRYNKYGYTYPASMEHLS